MSDSRKLDGNADVGNTQNIQGGQGMQVNNSTAPVIQAGPESTINSTVNIYQTNPATQLAEQPKTTTPHNLPLSGVAQFVGRSDDLRELHEQLQSNAAVAISAISGMGGIGKTELALQYALSHLDTYPGGVCWLRAREEVATQVVVFSRLQNRTPPENLELAAQVQWCWANWLKQPTLIVFDDVQQLSDIQAVIPPTAAQFKVLLTSRAKFGSPIQRYEIQVLSEAAALDLLRSLVQDGRIDQDLKTAKQICEWLGYLPLGLELVGRYLSRKPDLSVTTVWERLQAKRLEAQALEKDAKSLMTASLGVMAAFELSWQALSEPAQQLALVLSLFALAEIPWNLVEACLPGVEPETLEELRDEELLELNLLSRTGEGIYELHQLIREFFVARREQRANASDLKAAFCSVIARVAERIPSTLTLSLIQQITPLMPHFQEATTTLEPWLADADFFLPAIRIGQFYQGLIAFSEAEYWYQLSNQLSEKRLGADHPAIATSLNNLAGLYQSQGRYSEAEPLFLRSQQIWGQQLGAGDPLVARSFNNLAELYRMQGRYSEAEPLFLRSQQIWEQQLGADHPDVALSLNNLALLYYSQGRYSEAEPLFLRSQQIWEQQLGADHPYVAQSLNNLALLYYSQGRYSEAEPLYLRSQQILEQHLGADHPDVALSLNNLALLYCSQGRYSEAETLFLRCLMIVYSVLGQDHPNTQTFMGNFAQFLQQVIAENRTAELSDHSVTQALVAQLQGGEIEIS